MHLKRACPTSAMCTGSPSREVHASRESPESPHISRGLLLAPRGGRPAFQLAQCGCRFFSGFLHWHPLLAGLDYAWRMEPDVHYLCDMTAYDPFVFMQACACAPCPAACCELRMPCASGLVPSILQSHDPSADSGRATRLFKACK